MALKDLLVHLDGSIQSEARLRIAAELARRHGAQLTGLHVVPPLSLPALPIEAVGADVATFESVLGQWGERRVADTRRAEDFFWDQIRRNGIEGEFRTADGAVAEITALHARYADLCVVGQREPDHRPLPTAENLVEELLFASGRPVLVVPYPGRFETIGKTVLVGWNGTREAARAANDAIPILRQARSVTVPAVNPRRGIAGDGEVPAGDIARHLARHGVEVTAAHTVADEISVADALLNYAFDMAADLLVTGGYGHSRVRELVLGGVTRSLLRTMTLPVLFSH